VKILIVDDDRLRGTLAGRALERAGYGTAMCESAEKAKEILRSGGPIFWIICDLTMPNGSIGSEARRTGIGEKLRALRLGTVLNAISETCRERDVA
jgi:CheY-like chemotaxis protein